MALAGALLTPALTGSDPAAAASLERVPSFGSNPGALAMYAYRPTTAGVDSPVVVALHGCSQDAATYGTESGWLDLADRWGVTVVLPEQSSANNSSRCFNWFQAGDTRRGQGEAASIRSMVAHAVDRWDADPARVHVTGLSAGGAMTSSLLAAYPDVFAGGSVVAGIPTGCADSMVEAFTCMSAPPTRTPRQWGDEVRAAAPAGTTTWPTVAIWHGSSDAVVSPANATASRDQWTDVHGASRTPARTDTLPAGTTRQTYEDADGRAVVTTFTVQGMGHAVPVDPGPGDQQCGATGAYAADTLCSSWWTGVLWGLDDGTPDPEPTDPQPTDPQPTPTDPQPTPTEPEPTPTDPEPLGCWTSSTWAHTQAGRAYVSGGYAHARGSGDRLGLWNTFTTASVEQTGPDHYVRVPTC
ncbi:PHB depolymerase family esterase [Thalassiella azotivora]